MSYKKPSIIHKKYGNNIFAWNERTKKYGQSPTLYIPALIDGNLDAVGVGEEIVFEELEKNILKSCVGLRNFVNLTGSPSIPPTTIFDNHNHALYFWIDAVKKDIIKPGFLLIHIDQHSDLWKNEYAFNLARALDSENYAWKFVNHSCNVGNYISPAIESGLIGEMVRIENESQVDIYMNYIPRNNTVLNIDLDIFSPELNFIPERKKKSIIRNQLKHANYVTIATSPFFIDQGIAIRKLQEIFES